MKPRISFLILAVLAVIALLIAATHPSPAAAQGCQGCVKMLRPPVWECDDSETTAGCVSEIDSCVDNDGCGDDGGGPGGFGCAAPDYSTIDAAWIASYRRSVDRNTHIFGELAHLIYQRQRAVWGKIKPWKRQGLNLYAAISVPAGMDILSALDQGKAVTHANATKGMVTYQVTVHIMAFEATLEIQGVAPITVKL